MKKTSIMGLLLLSGSVLTSSTICGHIKINSLKPIIFSPNEGKQWVEKCVEQYPEILWLADVNVRRTEEGQASSELSYSEQLFGQKYIEFDRTMMTIQCLKLILDGSEKAYQTFTDAQPKENKLSKESFHILHLQGKKLLTSKWGGMSEFQMAQAMETALVLGDMGKSEKARKIFAPYKVNAIDQDDFYGEAMSVLEMYPEVSPSFAQLSSPGKKLLIEVANLAHYGHVTHLEGSVTMFTKLKKSAIPSKDPIALSFDLFIHTCDVAGALGHVNKQSSLAYTELTHRGLQAMGESVKVLSNPQKTELDAYNTYLGIRASWLGLKAENRLDRVLVRIGAMLRLFTPEEGMILKKAISELDKNVCDNISAQLDDQTDQINRTPTYMPALLLNLFNNPYLGSSNEERLSKAVTLGLPFIARVLEKYKELIANKEIDPNIPLNFNKMAGIAKTSPESLRGAFYIDKNGTVLLVIQ